MHWWLLQIVFTILSSSFIAGWDFVFYLLLYLCSIGSEPNVCLSYCSAKKKNILIFWNCAESNHTYILEWTEYTATNLHWQYFGLKDRCGLVLACIHFILFKLIYKLPLMDLFHFFFLCFTTLDIVIMYSLLHNMCLYQCFYLFSLQPGMEDGRNCYADEHYLPTVFHVSTQRPFSCWN